MQIAERAFDRRPVGNERIERKDAFELTGLGVGQALDRGDLDRKAFAEEIGVEERGQLRCAEPEFEPDAGIVDLIGMLARFGGAEPVMIAHGI